MTTTEEMYISAVRYALPRRTYIVPNTVKFMMEQSFSPHAKKIMIRDIWEALGKGETGSDLDSQYWRKLYEHLTK